MNKKKKCIWKVVTAIATVIIPLFIFFTGHETFRDFLCEKETETPSNIEQKSTTGISMKDSANVTGSINQQVGDNNNQTNIYIK